MKMKQFGISLASFLMAMYIYLLTGIDENELFPVLVGMFVVLGIHFKLKSENRVVTIVSFVLACYITFSFYFGHQSWKINSEGFLTWKNILISLTGVPYMWLSFINLGDWWKKLSIAEGIDDHDSENVIKRRIEKSLWPLIMVGMVICWIPALVFNYPGIIISDYTWQYSQALGESLLSNHHPIIHTGLIKFSQWICKLIFGTVMAEYSVFINSVIQMIILAGIIAYIIARLWKEAGNKYVRLLVILAGAWYAFFPMNALFSIYMTKDVIFSALVLLWSFLLIKDFKTDNPNKIQFIREIVVAILVMLFRSNGFFIVFGTLIVLIAVNRKCKSLRGMFLLLLMVFMAQNPILNIMNAQKTEIVESIGMPINQIANIVKKDEILSDNEREDIEAVISLESIKENYNVRYSDQIKFNPDFNASVIENNKGRYLKLWVQLFLKYPVDCLEASLNLTIGYWYPGVDKGCISYDYDTRNSFYEQLGIQNYSTNELYRHFISADVRRNMMEAWLWSPGFAVLIMLVMLFLCISQETYGLIKMFVPGIFGGMSLLIATPSYCETRYIYFVFLLIPVWVVNLFIAKKNKSDKLIASEIRG